MSSWFSSEAEAVYPTVSAKPVATGVANEEATVAGLTEDLKAKLSEALAMFTEFQSSAPETWESCFTETKGVKGSRKFVEGQDLAVIRCETVIPCHIVDVLAFVSDTENIKKSDEMLESSEVLSKLSDHSYIALDKVKGVWPVSPRDFLDMYHWRVLDDGSVIIFHFSVVDDALKPADTTEAVVRGNMLCMGYLLRTSEDGQGTDVRMIFNSNPGGSLPTFMVNQVVLSQPTALVKMKEMLMAKKEAGGMKDMTASATYEGE